MQQGPTLIGLQHLDFTLTSKLLSDASDKIVDFLAKAKMRKKKRTIFIEMRSEQLNNYIERALSKRLGFSKLNPFGITIAWALKNGWKVVPLDRFNVQALSHLAPPEYLNKNVRERLWANKIAFGRTPKVFDIIIMHPNHIWGFVKECQKKGIEFQRIKFLSPFNQLDPYKRQSEKEVAKLRTLRNAKRKRKLTTPHRRL